MSYNSGSQIHNRDLPENFPNSLIERTGRAAFHASNLILKPFRPLLGALKTDQEVFLSVRSINQPLLAASIEWYN